MIFPFAPKIQTLVKRHDRGAFSCGKHQLDRYLRTVAIQDIKKRVAVTKVLCKEGSAEIIVFYTLASTSADIGILPEETTKALPSKRPIPCTLLAQFAVSEKHQGTGISKWLLGHVLKVVLDQSFKIGSFGMIVDAVDDEAYNYWEKQGFIGLGRDESKLFLPMKTIAQAFP